MKLTEDLIERRTKYSIWRYEDMVKAIEKYEQDESKERRLGLMECRACYYLKEKVALQAFTDYDCCNCGCKNTHHNSNHPFYCVKCAKEHDICVRCGGKL